MFSISPLQNTDRPHAEHVRYILYTNTAFLVSSVRHTSDSSTRQDSDLFRFAVERKEFDNSLKDLEERSLYANNIPIDTLLTMVGGIRPVKG